VVAAGASRAAGAAGAGAGAGAGAAGEIWRIQRIKFLFLFFSVFFFFSSCLRGSIPFAGPSLLERKESSREKRKSIDHDGGECSSLAVF